MGELKSSGDITNSLLKALTARLSSSEQEALETNLIRGVIEKFTKDGITDFSKVSDTLKNAPFESKRAVEIMGELNKKAPILNNTSSLLEKLIAINPKAKELQQGIGHSVTGALMTMKRNLAIERLLKSLLPVLGNDASLKNHIRNAINNAGDLKSAINNLEKIEIKDAPENSTKLLEAFKNEVKALREETQTGEIKGDGFVVKNGGKLTFMDEAKFELSKELQGKTDLGEKISTSLAWLHSKHPEMFENKRAVKELIDYVLDEPNTIKAGKSENSVYLGKKDDTKIKDIAVNKSENKIIHANSRKMNASEKKERASEDALHSHTDTKPAGALKLEQDARLARNSEIISQKDKNTKTINASPHIASGLLGGTANGADENGNVSPEEFAKGFIYALFGSKFSASAVKRISPELYNSILGLGKKMPQMAKDNPKLLTKIYGSAKSNSINSFAGEKALNASANKLSKAKAMLEKGEDEVKIWQSTGWYKDKDGAWKFEIDDSPAKIKNQNADKLGDLLEHKELFKAYPELRDISVKKIGDDIPDDAALSVKNTAQKEKRGIYNVAYNDKSATLVRRDLEKIDDALMFEKGSSKKGGAIHIKKHLEPEAQGAITQSELLNIGKNIREYLQKYKEPFIDEHGGRIYEWANKEGVKFRVVVYEKTDGISASHPETIISFYSNRNLKKPMEFRNPEVKYDVNLRQWHKDSAPITKNADGSPKVFYHGSKTKSITEFKDEFDKSGYGFWFNQSKSTAVEFKQDGKIYQVYLNVKNPIDLSFPYSQKAKNLLDEAEKLGIDTELYPESQSGAFKKFLEQKGYDGIVMDDLDGAAKYPHVIVFHSNQIKHVKNNGNFSDSPNIYKSDDIGYYDPRKKEIALSDLGDKSTLMHEIQHAIQDIEGFAKGSNTNDKKYALSSREDGVNFSKKLPELKEKRGIYNVTYNGKNSTQIKQDLDNINDAIKYE